MGYLRLSNPKESQVLIQVIPSTHFEKTRLFLSCYNFDPKSFRFISRTWLR
ncbi:hypothetical protein MA16_Dca000938 [Dendrobium catenatum]|uniref:Uncharacterized protein n=1 Tax=Dendrobium catenatum TaxID=906689 RepID=A0A2I0WVA8_9ASPA|nr:hypothetical protein MA16_Dca000938 [Dendrobium catenatum]